MPFSAQFLRLLKDRYNIPDNLLNMAEMAEDAVKELWDMVDCNRDITTANVLEAFQSSSISEYSLSGSTGYGYHDPGRDGAEAVYSAYFGAESALVRPQIASGTHALSCCLFGNLRPGDTLVSLAGRPYDTMEKVIGIKPGGSGSLKDFGVNYQEVSLDSAERLDYAAIRDAAAQMPKMVLLQRSKGYSTRPSISIAEIAQAVRIVKELSPSTIFFVDNCYGEFVEPIEPTHVGADLLAGSLIKNPGGAIAPTGGYIVGRTSLVDNAAARLTAPGVGRAIGATLDTPRLVLQGFFLAPGIVAEALKGAIFISRLFAGLGFKVSPRYDAYRTDIIQTIEFLRPELLVGFCQGLQKASPVDSYVVPEPAEMPGYSDQVIMAGGTFITGSSIEMSADGALRPPYNAFYQGGVSLSQVKIGSILAADQMVKVGLV